MIVDLKADESVPDREGDKAEVAAMKESESKPTEAETENATEDTDAENGSEPDPKNEEPAEDDLCTLWVGQLHKNVTEEILYELFLQAGPVIAARIPNDKEGKKRSFGFVEYVYDVSVPYAMALFEGTKLFGREIRMNSKNPVRINMEKVRRDMAFLIHQNQRQKMAAALVGVPPSFLVPEVAIARPLLPCPIQASPLLSLPVPDHGPRPRPLLDNASWQSPQLGRGLMGPYPVEAWVPPVLFQPRPRDTTAPTLVLRPAVPPPPDWNAVRGSTPCSRPLLMQQQRPLHPADDPRRYMDAAHHFTADKRFCLDARKRENGVARPILCEKKNFKLENSDVSLRTQPTPSSVPNRSGDEFNSSADRKQMGTDKKNDTLVTKDCACTKSICSDLRNFIKDKIKVENNYKEDNDSKKRDSVKLTVASELTDRISCDEQTVKETKTKVEKVELADVQKVKKISNVEKPKIENGEKREKSSAILYYNGSDDESIIEAMNDNDKDIYCTYDSNKNYESNPHSKEGKDPSQLRIDVKTAVYSNSAYKSSENIHDEEKDGSSLRGKMEENGKEKAFVRWADRLMESQSKTVDSGFVFRKSPPDVASKPLQSTSNSTSHKPAIDHPLQLLNSSLQSSFRDGNKNIDPIQAFVKMAESNKFKQIECNQAYFTDPKPTPVVGKSDPNNEEMKIDSVKVCKSTKVFDADEQLKATVIKSPPQEAVDVSGSNVLKAADFGRMKTYSQVVNSSEAPKLENGLKSYSQVVSKTSMRELQKQQSKQCVGAICVSKAPSNAMRCRDVVTSVKIPEERESRVRNSNVLRDVKLYTDKMNASNRDETNQLITNASDKSYIVLEDMSTIAKKEQECPLFRSPETNVPKKSYPFPKSDPCGIIDEIMRQAKPVEIITDCGSGRYVNQSNRTMSNGKFSRLSCGEGGTVSEARRDTVSASSSPPPPTSSSPLPSPSLVPLPPGDPRLGVGRDGVSSPLVRGRGRGQARCSGQATVVLGPCRRPTVPLPTPGCRR